MSEAWIKCLLVGCGGAVGAMGRYLIGLIPIGKQDGFPIKTLAINVIGAFVIGWITVLAQKYDMPTLLVLALKTGVCGGFTTFSTFALETNQLMQGGSYVLAAAYVLASVVLSVGAVCLVQLLAH